MSVFTGSNGDRPLHAMVQVEERGRAMQDVERVEQRHYAGAGCGEGVRVLGVGWLVCATAALALFGRRLEL